MPCRLLISAARGVTCAARALPTVLQLCLASRRKLHSQIHPRRLDYAPNALVEEDLLVLGRCVGVTSPRVVLSLEVSEASSKEQFRPKRLLMD